MRVPGVPMQIVGGEPSQGEGRCVCTANDDGTSTAQIGHNRVVDNGEVVFLGNQAVGGGVACLVHVHLDGDGDTRQKAWCFASRKPCVEHGGSSPRLVMQRLNDRVDGGVDLVHPSQGRLGNPGGGQVTRGDTRDNVRGRKGINIFHVRLLCSSQYVTQCANAIDRDFHCHTWTDRQRTD